MPTLTRWDPWTRDVFDLLRTSVEAPAPQTFLATVNVLHDAAGYELRFDIPGVDPSDVDVSVHEGVLIVRGQRTSPLPEGAKWLRRETNDGSFERRETLPKDADVDKVAARYEHGLLIVSIPKHEKATPRRIDVEVKS